MKILGAHAIVYSKDPAADRAFFHDVLRYPSVDAGGGWPIFALPPSELAFHPGKNGAHELYLICEDVQAFVEAMADHGLTTTPVQEERWGSLVQVTLPGGGQLGVYQPKHPLAHGAKAKAKKKPAKKAPKKKRALGSGSRGGRRRSA